MRVGNMRAIPGEKILNAVYSSQRNVQGIYFCFLRQGVFLDQGLRQLLRLLRNLQQWQAVDNSKTPLRRFWMTTSGF